MCIYKIHFVTVYPRKPTHYRFLLEFFNYCIFSRAKNKLLMNSFQNLPLWPRYLPSRSKVIPLTLCTPAQQSKQKYYLISKDGPRMNHTSWHPHSCIAPSCTFGFWPVWYSDGCTKFLPGLDHEMVCSFHLDLLKHVLWRRPTTMWEVRLP